MIILIDLDGIVVDLLSSWLVAYNNEWDDNLVQSDIVEWDMHLFVKPECGKKVYDILKRPNFFRELQPLPGAINGVTKLVEYGHIVKFASSPPSPEPAKDKYLWVKEYFSHLNFGMDDVILIKDKWLLSADVLIDDKADNLVKYKTCWPYSHTISIKYPYNRHLMGQHSIFPSYKNTEKAWKSIVNMLIKDG